MLLSVLVAEQCGLLPGQGPQGPVVSAGPEDGGSWYRSSGAGQLSDKLSCLPRGRWENVNKSLIRAIVFIPFSSCLNGLLQSCTAFYLRGEREKEREEKREKERGRYFKSPL